MRNPIVPEEDYRLIGGSAGGGQRRVPTSIRIGGGGIYPSITGMTVRDVDASTAQANQVLAAWAYEQVFGTRPQGESMPPIGNPNYSAGAIDTKPTQAGIEQNLDYALDRANLLLHRLECIHERFIGPQPMTPGAIDDTPGALLARSQYLAARLEQCLATADMIRACVDGS